MIYKFHNPGKYHFYKGLFQDYNIISDIIL